MELNAGAKVMSSTHEQAMNYVYLQVLQRVLGFLSRTERVSLQLLTQRLIVAAGGIDRIASYKVMIAHDGGRDSSYNLALLRAAQFSIAGRSPSTFSLRVATLGHPGLTASVMANIHRSYTALFMYEDPRVELLLIDDQEVRPFHHLLPMSESSRELRRSNILISGHLSAGDGRATFCNTCYLSHADFYQRTSRWGKSVDAIVSNDSPEAQRPYLAWTLHSVPAQVLRPETRLFDSHDFIARCPSSEGEASQSLATQHPSPDAARVPSRWDGACRPALINLFDLIEGGRQVQSPLLQELLGFRLDEPAFHFSETDCASPLLMGHLQGLQAQYLRGLTYQYGIVEYQQLAKMDACHKQMPADPAALALSTDETEEKVQARRALAQVYVQEAFGLAQEQLVCLLFAPFLDRGKNLEAFVRGAHPGMLIALADLHQALNAQVAPPQVTQWLTEVSGLPLSFLQELYLRQAVDLTEATALIARVRAGDPDSYRSTVRQLDSSEAVKEVSSGW